MMRLPIKFNRAFLPPSLKKLPSAEDPRILIAEPVDEISFSRAISTFKFGTTFKTTQRARFPLTISELATLQYAFRPVVLDVGASDGITSLDVIEALPFQKYYITDRNMEIHFDTSGKYTFFYDDNGNCILIVTDGWVVYSDVQGAIFPLGSLVGSLFRRAPRTQNDSRRIVMINPAVRKFKRQNIIVEKYDVFDNWEGEKVDLIIAANLLNRSYFSDARIGAALRNMLNALREGGRLAVIDNRRLEKASIFQFTGTSLNVERQINGGTEIEDLVLKSSA